MKVLIWDWNGTLLNDATIAWGAFNDLLVSYGHQQISFAHYQEIYGHPASRMYEAVGVDLGQHDFDRISADYHDFYRARSGEALLHHDTRATLQQMATQGR
jgi:phosphoglycolate phosphatase